MECLHATQRPVCRHGFPCASCKVKKDGVNKDRIFFCCPNDKENSCKFFEWIPDEPDTKSFWDVVNFSMPPLGNIDAPKNNNPKTLNDLTNKFLGCQYF